MGIRNMELVISKQEVRMGLVIAVTIGLVTISQFLVPNLGSAQIAPEFMITWKSNSYVPASYAGKIMPTRNTPINISLELKEDGKLANLSKNEVRWFVNNKLKQSGVGLKNFTFAPELTANQPQIIRIAIINYRGTDLTKTIAIPLANPEVVVTSIGANVFKAFSYFFNIDKINDLKWEWSANNIKATGTAQEPDVLTLDIQGGRLGDTVDLKLTVIQDILNSLETASYSIKARK